jgi:hypothetical protein
MTLTAILANRSTTFSLPAPRITLGLANFCSREFVFNRTGMTVTPVVVVIHALIRLPCYLFSLLGLPFNSGVLRFFWPAGNFLGARKGSLTCSRLLLQEVTSHRMTAQNLAIFGDADAVFCTAMSF